MTDQDMTPKDGEDEHATPPDDPRYCNGKKRQGPGYCTRPAGWGTGHVGVGKCKLHMGSTPMHEQAGQQVMVQRALVRLGQPVTDADPAEQLLDMVREAAGNVATLRLMVAELGDPAEIDRLRAENKAAPRPLYTAMFHPNSVATGEARPHVVVAMYDAERDRLVRYSKEAIQCGLAARAVKIQEQTADMVARVMMSLLDDPALGLSQTQRESGRRLAGQHMRMLSAS